MSAHNAAIPSAQALYEEAACGLVLTRQDGMIVRANQTFCRWIDRPASELVGLKVQDLLSMGGRIFHQTHWAPLLQMQGSVAEVKLEVLHRDGRTIPMMMNAVRRVHGDAVMHELATFVAEDRHRYERELLRARRHAEELLAKEQQAQQALTVAQARLRLALESAQLFVWDIDPETRDRRYESEVALLLGRSSASPVPQSVFQGCIEPEDREPEAQALSQAMDPACGVYSCVYRLNGFDGVQRTISATGRGHFNDSGALVQFVGMLQDISELSRQRAIAEDRALFAEQMMGIVSHDLRNPLAAIQMSAHLLGRGDLNANQLRVLERLNNSTARAHRLIADLLDFTQARLGRGLKLLLKEIDLHDLVSECVDELALAFARRSLRHTRTGEGVCVADPDRVVQMIGNLVANAVAYGAASRPITVSSIVEAQEFRIEVHNEGAAIHPHLMTRLFEPMTRGAQSGGADHSIGLGLFIVREIVRAHGGEVGVVSSIEHGTTFSARFPRAASY